MICRHAASGCNYPEGECIGHCARVKVSGDAAILIAFGALFMTVAVTRFPSETTAVLKALAAGAKAAQEGQKPNS